VLPHQVRLLRVGEARKDHPLFGGSEARMELREQFVSFGKKTWKEKEESPKGIFVN